MNRVKKIAVSILIILIGIMITTVSNATFNVYSDVVGSVIKDHHFYPNTALPGGTFFCIEPGVEFSPTLSSSEDASHPSGSTVPTNGNYLCTRCNPTIDLPWSNGTKYFYRFTEANTFSWHEHPDAAYVLAQMEEDGKLISWDTAYGIWNSSISNPKRPVPEGENYPIVAESQAYKSFYELIHGGATTNDIFKSLIKDESKNIKVGVNQKEGSYTVGPFKIDYPDGVYDSKNKFSWINSMEAVTNVGKKAVTILDRKGNEIKIDDLKKDGKETLDQKEFYIKFYSTEATEMSLKVKFGYVEHCDATMTKYTGVKIYRNWVKETSGKHEHVRYESYDPKEYYSNGEEKKKEIREEFEQRRYKAQDVSIGEPQVLMALSSKATKVYKEVEIEIPFGNPPGDTPPPDTPPPSKIPLTIKISGNVFLDKEAEKGNDGDDKIDLENPKEEGLAGIEVYLHDITLGDKVIKRTHTTEGGSYIFNKLNAQHKYYVEFVYNGMLYTNVAVGDLDINANDISKASENAHGHGDNRQKFNSVFSEISSSPLNYESPSRGGYNQVFLQEQIANTFKNIAEKFGNHGGSDEEVFAYDCRIHAYSEKNYPLVQVFTIDEDGNVIPNDKYEYIYDEKNTKYNQLHVNLGIEARPWFDLALYKDVFNATININGKQEIYTYDARKDWENKGFGYQVGEDAYIGALRDYYIKGEQDGIDNNLKLNKSGKNQHGEGEYIHEYRTEEIINGNNEGYIKQDNSWLSDPNYEKTLYGEIGKGYAWRDIDQSKELKPEDKLQIHVTYKIAIRNQSSVVGAITEIVDYYDSKYKFEGAYIGNEEGKRYLAENGDELNKVIVDEKSIYENTEMAKTGSWQVYSKEELDREKENPTHEYKTIYLRLEHEQRLGSGEEQYIYITFGLTEPESTLINAEVPFGKKLYTYNMAEINGYKTYGYYDKNIDESWGLIDKDSIPGNFNPSTYKYGNELEDDTSRAPAYAYTIRESRTLEGNVFEDMLAKNIPPDEMPSSKKYEVKVNTTRFGDGTINTVDDKMIAGIKVELIEIKDGNLYSRQTTRTNRDGWYGFGAFLPGDYTIRFTYGAEDQTALTEDSKYKQGLNKTSYNGQDYQSTIFTSNAKTEDNVAISLVPQMYSGEIIKKYTKQVKESDKEWANVDYYWYKEDDEDNQKDKSDAQDDAARRQQVIDYSKEEYGREITNHKAEVFNSYINPDTLIKQQEEGKFNQFTQAQPMDEAVYTKDKNRELVDELERSTYMYAYTPEIPIEVEKTVTSIKGNQTSDKYDYLIKGVDFGVVERPRAQLIIDQDIEYIKVTAPNGNTLLELEHEETGSNYKIIVNNENNYQWPQAGDFNKYDKDELVNIIMDDELLSGSKLEVRYKFTVTNNSEKNIGGTKAVNIINYVANNFNFDESDNDNSKLWEVVKKEDIQTGEKSTLINNSTVDLSTQTTILKAKAYNEETKEGNKLTKMLQPGESEETTLTLKKTLSSESSADDLKYTNMTEIVEIENDVGRRDYGAIPGNQKLDEQPREHDTSGASRSDDMGLYRPDGEIIITPPTGDTKIYYVLAAGIAVLALAGVVLIKKFVLGGKK